MERVEILSNKAILKQAKKQRKITQVEIAEKLGINQSAMSGQMNRTRMSIDGFWRILNAMDYDIVIVDRNSGEPAWKLGVPTLDPEVEDDDI